MKKIKKFLCSAFLGACAVMPQIASADVPPKATPPVKKQVKIETPEEKKNRRFQEWLKGVKKEAAWKGVSQKTIETALPGTLTPLNQVVAMDRGQLGGMNTLEKYLTATISDERVNTGATHAKSFTFALSRISETYGVEPEAVVALWGMESAYGTRMGNYNVVNALSSLAYDGRRSAYFRGELIKALQILDQEKMDPSSLKGSWAGAMGQVQFMPSAFFAYAVDFNKDGKRDIWRTETDALASAANYLHKNGWKKGEPWGHTVLLPQKFNRALLGLAHQQPLQFWRKHGLKLADGGDIPLDTTAKVSIIQPDGPGAEAFIVYDNFRVIMRWNQSTYFAVSAGKMADKIKKKTSGKEMARLPAPFAPPYKKQPSKNG